MDENTTSRKLRVLIYASEDNESSLPLKKFLLNKGCPVRLCSNVVEFIDIVKEPGADYGMVIVLSPVNEKIFKGLRADKRILMEFGPGRCNVTELLRKVDVAAKSFGRY